MGSCSKRRMACTCALRRTTPLALALLLLCAADSHLGAAQMMGGMMGGSGAPKAAANTADVPFIRCQACEALVSQAMLAVEQLRSAVSPGKPVRLQPGIALPIELGLAI